MFMEVRMTLAVDVKLTPVTVLLLIVPPVPAAPVPTTFKPPALPVMFRMMPEFPLAVGALILRNSKLFAPMFVLATFSAVPVVVVNVLTNAPVAPGTHGVSSQTLTVPPPVAVNAGFAAVLRTTPPLKVIVPPVLLVREIPLFELLTDPE